MRLAMTQQVTKVNFAKQDIFVGLDISKKSWKVCIYVGQHYHRSFSQPPLPEVLVRYLRTNFPGGDYHCVYEAGYFGYWIHQALSASGIDCLVVNPADVPTANWEKRRKTDLIDAHKLARGLASGGDDHLRPIYVPSQRALEDRALVRLRTKMIQHQTRCKNRIKSFLQYYGITTPHDIPDQHWSRNYLSWLEQVSLCYDSGNYVFRALLDDLIAVRKNIAELTRKIRLLASDDLYRDSIQLLCTIPGISQFTAITMLTELCSIDRFKTLETLASYVGLVPGEHSSGERQTMTGLTYRRNNTLRYVIIEAAWVAARRDPALMMCFNQWSMKMTKSKAIVKIARKLLSRIRFVLIHRQPYQMGVA